jgi:thioredoxin 1
MYLPMEIIMFTRPIVLATSLLSIFAFSNIVFAADFQKFTPAAFEQFQKMGKPILIEVHADWCPTCKAQKPAIKDITAADKFKDLTVFEVDFDAQKDVVKSFNAQTQSTLISFKGATEKARSVGDTKTSSITKLIEAGL